MNKPQFNLILSVAIAIFTTSCSDSEISQTQSSPLIGIWRKVDTNTVNITDSLGMIIGTSLRTITNDLEFSENSIYTSTSKYEYSPQYEYPYTIERPFAGTKAVVAKDSVFSKSSIWKLSSDTLKFVDTTKIYVSESSETYRSYATGYSALYSISNNILTLTSLIEQLKAEAPPPIQHYYRIKQ